VDAAAAACLAMDLTPLLHDTKLDPLQYTEWFIERFRNDVRARVKRCR
jgi:hypothetical protein